MPKYTATITRSITWETRGEKVELEAADDEEANQKIRDMEYPAERSQIVDITIVPWVEEDDVDSPAVDGEERQWVHDDDHVTMTLYRSDLEGEDFLNQRLDKHAWDDLQHAMESHLTLMDIGYAYLKDEWDLGPGRPPPSGWDLPPPEKK